MERYIFQSLLHQFRTGAEDYLKEYEKKPTHNKIPERILTMAKPTAKSTVSAMKDYIRENKLNKAPIRLGMKRDELIAGLRKLGHWDAQHDGVAPRRKPPAPKKPKAPAPKAPVRAIEDKKVPVPKDGLFPVKIDPYAKVFQNLAEVEEMEDKESKEIERLVEQKSRAAKLYSKMSKIEQVKSSKGHKENMTKLTSDISESRKDRNILRSFIKKAKSVKPARADKPKKEQVNRILRNRLMDDFKREHKGKTVWKILTLKPTATRDAIRARGRELMRKNHPDKGGNKETFQTIQQAVKLLMDTFV